MFKPIFKWAGGKSRLLPQILKHMPLDKRLVEPFAGGAAVSFNILMPKVLLNDSNPHLIDFYKTLKREKGDFIKLCKSKFTEEMNTKEKYGLARKSFNTSPDPALFLYLNRHGFNGLTRYNKFGKFNVPFGSYKKPYFPEQEMWNFLMLCHKMTFKCEDFRKIFKMLKIGDMVYCDPPYIPLSKTSSFTAFTADGFTENDQNDLATCAEQAAARGIPVLISNSDTPKSRDIFGGASCLKPIISRRSISAAGGSRKKTDEILAIYK